MRLALVILGFALLCAAHPAPLHAQSTSSSPSAVSAIETGRRPPPTRTIAQRIASQRVLLGGIATLVGVWLFNAAVTALASLAFYLEGTRPPCLPGLCGYEAVFATPLIPLVGSAMWSGLVLESPPLGRTWPATFGILAMLGQQVGLSMIVGAASDLARPTDVRVSGFANADGVWLGASGPF